MNVELKVENDVIDLFKQKNVSDKKLVSQLIKAVTANTASLVSTCLEWIKKQNRVN